MRHRVGGEITGQGMNRPGFSLSLWPKLNVLVWVSHLNFLDPVLYLKNEGIKPGCL